MKDQIGCECQTTCIVCAGDGHICANEAQQNRLNKKPWYVFW